jgi:hypothetical protein
MADSPQECRNGHPLLPMRVIVSFMRCTCDRSVGGGHHAVQCRVCGDMLFDDGHTDDSALVWPVPKLPESVRLEPL